MEYEISEEAYRCYIPRLILQPLVENALLHGIDIKRQTGKDMDQRKSKGRRADPYSKKITEEE